ncbi:unnamed protein product, partial [Effrenium voratum]
YIVVIGNPTGLMLRNFLAEIFHPDHAEDADDLHVSVILPHGHPGQDLVNEWLRQPENLRMLPRIHIFQGTALSDQDLPLAPALRGVARACAGLRSARTDELSALPGLGVVVDFALSRADTGAPLEWKEVSSPLSFTSGAGEVPDVLDEAVAGMALGESKRLLAYGEPSNEADEVWEISGQKLPPCDVPLSLDVTLLEVEVKQDPRGVAVKTLKPGDGRTFAEAGDRVTVHYIGRLAANGKQFDSTHDRAFPFEFHVGVGKVIPGFDMGMMRLSEGEKALLTIPSALAYGPRGSGKIPPGADLIFEVHLVKVVNRVTISSATCVFILPNLLCTSVMQEDTENIIRMMAVQRLVPKVRFILLLLRAENRTLLMEAQMDGNVTTVAYDQFKLEMAGKSCMVHGFGPLLSNLCKSIAIDDDDE